MIIIMESTFMMYDEASKKTLLSISSPRQLENGERYLILKE